MMRFCGRIRSSRPNPRSKMDNVSVVHKKPRGRPPGKRVKDTASVASSNVPSQRKEGSSQHPPVKSVGGRKHTESANDPACARRGDVNDASERLLSDATLMARHRWAIMKQRYALSSYGTDKVYATLAKDLLQSGHTDTGDG